MLHDLTVNSDYVTLEQLQNRRCGDTVEGYPEPALQQKTEGKKKKRSSSSSSSSSSSAKGSGGVLWKRREAWLRTGHV